MQAVRAKKSAKRILVALLVGGNARSTTQHACGFRKSVPSVIVYAG
jgi:hypothetical protein